MLSILSRTEPSRGLVFFRGTSAHRAEEYEFLRTHGIEIAPAKANSSAHWGLELKHPTWGRATLVAMRDVPMPSEVTLKYSAGLDDDDREMVRGAGWAIGVSAPAERGQVLRDRKNFLRFMRAVMGEDGVMAMDNEAMLFWPRGSLDDELQHDADLDVSSIYCLHAVVSDTAEKSDETDAPNIGWLHSHGLGRLGAYDFDILDCHESCARDVFRALAFAMLEGRLKPGAEAELLKPGGPVLAVDAAEFQSKATRVHAAMREAEDHTERRVVLCEPRAKGLRKLFGGSTPKPAAVFSLDIEGKMMSFSDAATELMAERARLTLDVMLKLQAEFAMLRPICGAKIACKTSDGGWELPWFEVHGIKDGMIDGTLVNQPFDIPTMEKGGRYSCPVSDLTDWTMQLHIGSVSPRSMSLARRLRAHPEMIAKIAEMLASVGDE